MNNDNNDVPEEFDAWEVSGGEDKIVQSREEARAWLRARFAGELDQSPNPIDNPDGECVADIIDRAVYGPLNGGDGHPADLIDVSIRPVVLDEEGNVDEEATRASELVRRYHIDCA